MTDREQIAGFGRKYLLVSLLFRLLYSPISILQEIEATKEKCQKTDQIRGIRMCFFKIFLVNLLFITGVSFLLYPLLVIVHFLMEGYQLFDHELNTYLYGSLFSIALTFLIFFALLLIPKKNIFTTKRFKVISGVMAGAWLVSIISGITFLMFSFFLETDWGISSIIRLSITLFFIGLLFQRLFQLISLTNQVDLKDITKKSRVLKKAEQSKKTQRLVILISMSIMFVLFVAVTILINKDFEKFSVIYVFLVMIALGWLTFAYSAPIGYIMLVKPFMKIFKFSIEDRVSILSSDEIIFKGLRYHNKLLSKAEAESDVFYLLSLGRYFSNTPYSEEIFRRFMKKIDCSDYELLLNKYLNASSDGVLFRNSDRSLILDYQWKYGDARKACIEILELVQNLIPNSRVASHLINKLFTLRYLNTIRGILLDTFNELEYMQELERQKSKTTAEFGILEGSFFHRINEKCFFELQTYIGKRIKDADTSGVTVRILEGYLALANGKGYLSVQIRNNENSHVFIEKYDIRFPGNENIKVLEFTIEKFLREKRTYEYFISLEATEVRKFKIEIDISYIGSNNESHFLRCSKAIPTVLVKEFEIIDNPYSLRPVRRKEMFLGRKKEVDGIVAQIKAKEYPSIMTITAERRLGKTSLLRNIENTQIDEFDVVFMDMMAFENIDTISIGEFFSQFLEKLNLKPEDSDTAITLDSFLKQITKKKYLIMMDEFDVFLDHFNGQPLLKKIRNYEGPNRPIFIFSLPWQPLQCSPVEIKNILLSEYRIILTPFPKRTAIELITEPVKSRLVYTPAAIEYIYSLCGGFAIYLQAFCADLIRYVNSTRESLVTLEVIKNMEAETAEEFASYMNVYLNSISIEYVKVLIALKKNGNRIERKNIEFEVNRYFPMGLSEGTIEKMEEENIVGFKGEEFYCTSVFLLEELNRIDFARLEDKALPASQGNEK